MATIAVHPLVLKDVLLTVGTDNYEAHVSSVTFTPSASTVTWKGLTPTSVHTAGTTATWTVDLTYVQDWDTPNSLSAYLFDNEGEEVTVTFEPVNGGDSFGATIIAAPGAIGGAVDTFGETTVSLGVKGKPVRTPAV